MPKTKLLKYPKKSHPRVAGRKRRNLHRRTIWISTQTKEDAERIVKQIADTAERGKALLEYLQRKEISL